MISRFEITCEEHEAADEGAGPALAVVAVHDTDILNIIEKMFHHNLTDFEQNMKFGCFMILPVKRTDVR